MIDIAEELVVLVDEVVGEYYEHEFVDIDQDEYKGEGEKVPFSQLLPMWIGN